MSTWHELYVFEIQDLIDRTLICLSMGGHEHKKEGTRQLSTIALKSQCFLVLIPDLEAVIT